MLGNGCARAGFVLAALAVLLPPFAHAAMPAPTANRALSTTDCANPALPRVILAAPPAAASTPSMRTEIVVAPHARLTVAVAATEAQRELGLMCVVALQRHAGMIFLFARDDTVEFWMKHTLIPLDMIWLDANGRVTTVAAHVPASTMQTADADVARRSGSGHYVIELNSGEAAKDGIKTGTHLKLPR